MSTAEKEELLAKEGDFGYIDRRFVDAFQFEIENSPAFVNASDFTSFRLTSRRGKNLQLYWSDYALRSKLRRTWGRSSRLRFEEQASSGKQSRHKTAGFRPPSADSTWFLVSGVVAQLG